MSGVVRTAKVNDRVLAARCRVADSALERLVGLLNRSGLAPDEGLLLDPCNQVHSLFMRFTIDVVFLNAQDEVVAFRTLRPWRMSRLHFRARRTLELPRGRCQEFGLRVGDRLSWEDACSS